MDVLTNNLDVVGGSSALLAAIYMYLKDRKNFGLTDIQNQRQKNVEAKVEKIYEHITRHHELSEERQERMAETLDDISKNMLKMSVVLDSILNKLNKS